jgi:N-formylglutamate deformylase
MSPVILHIPHASKEIPKGVRSTFLPSDEEIERELLLMTDAWTDEIVGQIAFEVTRVIFPVSRLVVDPERFPDDANEPMAARGMGAVYTRLSTGEPLRVLSHAERRKLMATYYEPHHAKLEKAVATALGQFGHCLIIDMHSFSSMPLPHELDQSVGRPEICIGFDPFHSPFNETSDLKQVCGEHGYTAALNRPFIGSIVPSTYWNIDARVRSFMIEIRRDVYMEEAIGLKRVDFPVVSRRVCSLVEELVGNAVDEKSK